MGCSISERLTRIHVYLTNRCNFNCVHCYVIRPEVYSITYKEMELILRKLAELKVTSLSISGGEPFMHDNLVEMLRLMYDYGFKVTSILTNGSLISETVAARIREMHGDVRFYVSLDGLEREHVTFRRIPTRVYGVILENIKLLKKLGFEVAVNTMLHRLFTAENVRSFMRLLKALDIDIWRVDVPFYEGEWRVYHKLFDLNIRAVVDYLCDIILYWIELGRPYDLELSHFVKTFGNTFYISDSYSIDDFVCPCTGLVVWPDKSVSWCASIWRKEYTIGNILEDDISEIINRYMEYKCIKIRDLLGLNEECATCPYLEYCGLGCMANAIFYGEGLYRRDPVLCGIYRGGLFEYFIKKLNEKLGNLSFNRW